MEVSVKLYASLRRYRPNVALGKAFPCKVSEGTTIRELMVNALGMPPEEVAIALVNGMMTDPDQPVKAGDQVALFPPVAGG